MNAIDSNYGNFTASARPVHKVQGKPLGVKSPQEEDEEQQGVKKAGKPQKFAADLGTSFSSDSLISSGNVGSVGSTGPSSTIAKLSKSSVA